LAKTLITGDIDGPDDNIKFVSVNFDAVTRRSEDNTATVTKHPVESGFSVSDHVRLNNLQLSVEGQISEANNSLLNRVLDNVSDITVARSNLKSLFNTRKPVILITPEETYEDMIITSLVFEKSNPTRGLLTFRLRLEQIRTSSSKTALVSAQNVSSDVSKAIQKENTEGTVGTNSVDTDKVSSQLFQSIQRGLNR